MSRIYESDRVYNDQLVEVFATDFEGCGGLYGPTCIWATLDGADHPLTDEQQTEIAQAATAWITDDNLLD